jgi:hypothetical protein
VNAITVIPKFLFPDHLKAAKSHGGPYYNFPGCCLKILMRCATDAKDHSKEAE